MRCIFAGMVLMLGGLVGCDATQPGAGTGGGGGGSTVEPVAADGHKSYAAADLPGVEEQSLPIADQGRVEITLPAGWKPLARNPKFLVACIPEDSSANKLPRITVAVSEPAIDDKTSVTADNVQEFVEKMRAQWPKEGKKAIESQALVLGENAWARHVRRATFSDDPVAIQSLQTIRSGRLYTVELTVTAKDNPRKSGELIYKDTLQTHRNLAYAVAANMKFPKDSDSAPATTEPATPADEKPSSDKPAAEPSKSE